MLVIEQVKIIRCIIYLIFSFLKFLRGSDRVIHVDFPFKLVLIYFMSILLTHYLMSCPKLWLVGGSNPLKGDMLVIAGSTLYAVSNVSEVS